MFMHKINQNKSKNQDLIKASSKTYIIQQCVKELAQVLIMQQEVTLVAASTLEGHQQQFYIYNNIILGQGGFGVVKKAFSAQDKSRQLAVKIIPINGDPIKRSKIQRQISILRLLPQHPNIVRVLPLKCFSQNNFYIFMEICKDGTLVDLLRKPNPLPQQKIIDIFYQLLSGYRVLQQNGILHQDLKLGNVLLKNGTLKITDFGFSILAQKYVTSLVREGTMHYMPLQKLTDANYVANEKADIYALGVMMFQVIGRIHPYIGNQKTASQRQFVLLLRSAPLIRPRVLSMYSGVLHKLFDLLCRMVAKLPANRPSCEELYEYIDDDLAFAASRARIQEKSGQIVIQPLPITVTAMTQTFVIPFSVQQEKEQEYIEKIKEKKEAIRTQNEMKIIREVQQWVLGYRLIVYFMDRLARRLYVEKLKVKFTENKQHTYNQAILGCLLLASKITRHVLRQMRFPEYKTPEEIDLFKSSHQGIRTLQVIERDERYIDQQVTDNLKKTNQVHIKDQKMLADLSKKEGFGSFVTQLKSILSRCIEIKAQAISHSTDLVTIVYLIDSLDILTSLSQKEHKLSFQEYFHRTQTTERAVLLDKIMEYLDFYGVPHMIDSQLYNLGVMDEKEEEKQEQAPLVKSQE